MKVKNKKSLEVEEDYDEEEEQEDVDEEMEKELEEEEMQQVKKPVKPQVSKNLMPKIPTARFSHYRQEASDFLVDTTTNKPVAGDIWSVLTIICNDLEVIKDRLGDMTN